jgi:hypothetical protein
MPPPPDYYLGHLRTVVDWIRRHHGALIDARLAGFLATLDRLPAPAARLLVRLLARRGPDFRVDGLAYPEVGPPTPAALALVLAGVARLVPETGARIEALRVDELRERLAGLGVRRPGARRAALVEALVAEVAAGARPSLPVLLRLRCRDEVDCARLLFFGSLHQDLTEFVLADLGTLRWPRVALRPRLPWVTPAAVRRSLAVHRLADLSHDLVALDDGTPDLAAHLRTLAGALDPAPTDAHAATRRERALLRLAARAGRLGETALELDLLARCSEPPARERRCRRLAATGAGAEAEALRRAMLAAPRDAGERRFAERFEVDRGRCRPRRRRGGAIRFERLVVPGAAAHPAGVEACVAAALAARGQRALHMENRLPGMLFALGFWDLIHAPLPGAFVQPFQSGPTDLRDGRFARRRAGPLAARLEAIADGRYGTTDFLRVLEREQGTVNPFWSWPAHEVAEAPAIVAALAPPVRAAVCAPLVADPRGARAGFPDLVVTGGGTDGRFLEVKGPGDALRDGQRDWLEHLVAAGVDAAVVELRFA